MAMDLERRGDGGLHFTLGPVERWVAGIVTAGFMAAAYWFVTSTISNQSETNKSLQTLVTQQAVTNAQITTLSTQLADVPALTRQMAELQVQVKRNTSDIDELRKLRGLK